MARTTHPTPVPPAREAGSLRGTPTTARPDGVTAGTTTTETTGRRATRYVLAALRLSLGWVFLWAFLDKVFGLGRATPPEGAWLDGGSPTAGFLGNAPAGPFAPAFRSIAGAAWADWMFMAALLAIGTALLLGIGMRVAAASGSVLLVLMWAAVLPPANNPFMDDHLVYAMVLVLLALTGSGRTWGLGRRWEQLPLVARTGFLK